MAYDDRSIDRLCVCVCVLCVPPLLSTIKKIVVNYNPVLIFLVYRGRERERCRTVGFVPSQQQQLQF